MGNLCGSCFSSWKEGGTTSNTYFREEHENEALQIEFENLVDEGESGDANPPFITDSERQYLISKNYEKIVEDQRKLDDEIDSELAQREDDLKVEEEAYIAAKKESARVARQKKLEEEKKKKKANGHPSGWLGGNESEWDVAGGEDDFEMFLESVKARSLNTQANIPSHTNGSNNNYTDNYYKSVSVGTTSAYSDISGRTSPLSTIDLEWDHEQGMDGNPLEFDDQELTEAELVVASRNQGMINAGVDSDIEWEWDQDLAGAGELASGDTVPNSNGNPSTNPATAGKTAVHSGNPNEFVTEVQIETVDRDLTFDDDDLDPVPPKTGSRELLAESEADR